MNKDDKIKELFARKLHSHEMPVSPQVWQAVASKIGADIAIKMGVASVVKIVVGIACVGSVALGTYWITSQKTETSIKKNNRIDTPQNTQKIHHNKSVKATSVHADQSTNDRKNKEERLQKTRKNEIATETQIIEETQYTTLEKNELKTENSVPSIFVEMKTEHVPTAEHQKTAHPKTPIADQSHKTEDKIEMNRVDQHPDPDQRSSFEIVRLPNIYSLHASGYFAIEYQGEYRDFQLTIMSENNRVVFSTNDPNIVWQGLDTSGQIVSTGTYYYILTVTDLDGRSINKYSSLRVEN